MDRKYYIYILTNKSKKSLYTGVTNNLSRRMREHKKFRGSKFCARYKINRLIYFEEYTFIMDAINREKQIKRWNRSKKENLISSVNPDWKELSFSF